MRWRVPLLITLVAFLAVSCDQQPVAPTSDQTVAEAPAFNFMNGPDRPGKSPISRYEVGEWHYWCGTTDPARDLQAFHYDAWDWFCNEGTGHPVWQIQEKWTNRLNLNGFAYDEPLYIYDMSDLWDAYGTGWEAFCTFLAEGWLFHGAADMHASESWHGDFSQGLYQMMAEGTVYDHGDVPYLYTEKQKYTTRNGWTHEDIIVQ